MASEIRVDKINSLSGVGTVTLSPTGVDIAGITTAATLRATTGIITSLTTGSLTSLGAVSGTTGTFSGAVSGTTGTFTGDVDIADTIVHTGDTNTKIRFPSADTVSMEVAGSEGFKVDATGTTITTSTDASLFINTTNSNGSHVRFQTNGTNKTFLGQAAGISGSLGGADDFAIRSAEDIVFSTNDDNTPNLKIDTSGNLILGATSYQNGGFGGTSSGINIAGTQPQILLHETDTDKDGYFGLAGSILRIQTADSIPVTIWTNDTKRINVHETTGDTTIETGNLVIGTSGKGIDFSATGDSGGTTTNEVFDDYEEGTFTPTSNATISGQYGVYTKIGRQVTIHIRLVVGSQTNGTAFAITGLPYNANMLSGLSNGSQPGGFGYISGSPFSGGGVGGNGEPQIHMRYNNNYVEFYNFGSALSITTWSGREMRLGFIYYVD